MEAINVKVKLMRENIPLPTYATDGSAALDLRAAIDAPIVLAPGKREKLPTGIAIAPESANVVAILCARSGLAAKHGITLANGIGVIDSDYRGEISAVLVNNGDLPYTIQPGDRIAQLMLLPLLHARLLEAETLDETERGEGGFGSTGAK